MKRSKGCFGFDQFHYTDVPAGCTHFVVVDDVEGSGDTSRIEYSALPVLKIDFLQRLTREWPSVGIATLQKTWGFGAPLFTFADYVNRNCPLLMLDSRHHLV